MCFDDIFLVYRKTNQTFEPQFGVLELPPDLELAKKSLSSTMSALYAMMIVAVCIVFTSTEIITNKVNTIIYSIKRHVMYIVYIVFIFRFQ